MTRKWSGFNWRRSGKRKEDGTTERGGMETTFSAMTDVGS
jgi:hypothetical protein